MVEPTWLPGPSYESQLVQKWEARKIWQRKAGRKGSGVKLEQLLHHLWPERNLKKSKLSSIMRKCLDGVSFNQFWIFVILSFQSNPWFTKKNGGIQTPDPSHQRLSQQLPSGLLFYNPRDCWFIEFFSEVFWWIRNFASDFLILGLSIMNLIKIDFQFVVKSFTWCDCCSACIKNFLSGNLSLWLTNWWRSLGINSL